MEIGLLLVLGWVAGWLTTVAGLGGGVFLILALSLRMSPAEALALSSPALLIGNLHRLAVGRDEVDRRIAVPFALGALPGSALGGLLVVAMPTAVLQLLLVLTSALALARALGWWLPRPPAAALVPAGAAIGAMAATTGGAGLALGAVLQSAGLTGAAYVATAAAAAVAMHVGRIAAYGLGGLVTGETMVPSAVLAVAILAGNLAGGCFRKRLSARAGARIELGVLFACVALALVGLA
ncbi:sulfite exporter TauE/SafE family protein [Nannocystis sp. ILAH1]|uniref:TSUP family transporter n=1 Tax=unclassified Nannocystis TaxID=2627009 RepID=UPI002270C7B2|nr:sulfite exporter TauE/SafE family protein [Nannocystis sp. ILAH1]MCY1072457.1 sulfite exporter TauE/SafE family protein [Nannocystis sp. RBIL2]